MNEVFVYSETVEDGQVVDRTRWFTLMDAGYALDYIAEFIATAKQRGFLLRTLCVGFAEDYDRMVPRRVSQRPRMGKGPHPADFAAAVQAGLDSGELVLDPCYLGDELQSVAIVHKTQVAGDAFVEVQRKREYIRHQTAIAEIGRVRKQREEERYAEEEGADGDEAH